MDASKKIFMIAGPNGAGKTTTALSLIDCVRLIDEFINADEIARGLAPLHPESMSLTASKLMIKRVIELLGMDKTFAFETTGSGINYTKHLKEAKKKGYEIHLIFLWLSSPDLAVNRVAKRVVQGGHRIPEDIIRRRYVSGIKNLIQHYFPLSDRAIVLDNSLDEMNNIIAFKDQKKLQIIESTIWEKIEKYGR